MVDSGVDLVAVSKVLGHADVASGALQPPRQDTLFAAVEAGAKKQAAACPPPPPPRWPSRLVRGAGITLLIFAAGMSCFG